MKFNLNNKLTIYICNVMFKNDIYLIGTIKSKSIFSYTQIHESNKIQSAAAPPKKGSQKERVVCALVFSILMFKVCVWHHLIATIFMTYKNWQDVFAAVFHSLNCPPFDLHGTPPWKLQILVVASVAVGNPRHWGRKWRFCPKRQPALGLK